MNPANSGQIPETGLVEFGTLEDEKTDIDNEKSAIDEDYKRSRFMVLARDSKEINLLTFSGILLFS